MNPPPPPRSNAPPLQRLPKKKSSPSPKPPIPQSPFLLTLQSSLPSTYNFEVPKTLSRLKSLPSLKTLCLQMPEGLLMYGTTLADCYRNECGIENVIIMGDVTYGACCVDDITAKTLGADFMVHYGHSCLVPINKTLVKAMYVFVEIDVDADHCCGCFSCTVKKNAIVNVMCTVQFRKAAFRVKKILEGMGYEVVVPRAKPLSTGEVLGCTSPKGLFRNDVVGRDQCECCFFFFFISFIFFYYLL